MAANPGSHVPPSTTATFEVNPPPEVPPGYVALYDTAGRQRLVLEADAAAIEQRDGLSRVRYDIGAAAAEWLAAHEALAPVVAAFLEECARDRYLHEEGAALLNLAAGREIDALRALITATAATLPTENQVVDLSLAVAEHGAALNERDTPALHDLVTQHAAAIAAVSPEQQTRYATRAAGDAVQRVKETQ